MIEINYVRISNDELNILNKNGNKITLFYNPEQTIMTGTNIGILTEGGHLMYAKVKDVHNLMFNCKDTKIIKTTKIARYRCLRRLYSEFLENHIEKKESRILWLMSHCFVNYLITRNYFSDCDIDLELMAIKWRCLQ